MFVEEATVAARVAAPPARLAITTISELKTFPPEV
jgi:hypothetical protein